MAASICSLSSRQARKYFALIQHRKAVFPLETRRNKSTVSGTKQNEVVMDRDIVPFWSMMEQRRKQADKSILVKLCEKTSITTLLQYCTSHGKVSDHFSYFQQGRYAVIEFKSSSTLESLLRVTEMSEVKKKGRTPPFVHSRFLTFSRPAKQKLREQRQLLNREINHSTLMDRLCQSESVSGQIDDMMNQEKLQEPEVRLRFLVCSLIEEAFKNILPDCTLYPFGSSVNCFGRRNCDIDMYLDRGTKNGVVPISKGKEGYQLAYDREAAHSDRVAAQTTLSTLASYLHRHVPHASAVFRILKATCPLVKFRHNATGLLCDLTADKGIGLKSTELLYTYGQLDRRVCPLVFLVRYWARFHDLTSMHPDARITNFPLTLLVVYFLQTRSPPVVPSMNQLTGLADKGDGALMLEIDPNNISESENKETLEELLQEFFHFLCTFDFHHQGVSVKRGEPFPHLDDQHSLHIENPLETEFNTSKNVSVDHLNRMRERAREALETMQHAEFHKSADSDGSWGVPLLIFFQRSARREKSPELRNRIDNILKDLKR